jgi:hypothetical protein
MPASLQEAKAHGRIGLEREKEAPAGPQTGVEAQKLNVHIIPDCRSNCCSHACLASGETTPTKMNRAGEVIANSTWARSIRDGRSPAGGIKPAKGR